MRMILIDRVRRRVLNPYSARLLYVVIAVVSLMPAAAYATQIGDLDFSPLPQPSVDGKPINKVGGYVEHRIRIRNESADKDHTVQFVQSGVARYTREISLDRNSRTVQVTKGATVVVSLFEPIMGNPSTPLEVVVDGVKYENVLTITTPFHFSNSSTTQVTAVLCGRGISQDYRDELRAHFPDKIEFCRSELPVTEWSPNWLGYTAYDVVLLTDQEAKSLPEDVQTGLQRYVESGGVLHVVGTKSSDDLTRAVPAGMLAASSERPHGIFYLGFGEIRLQTLSQDDDRRLAFFAWSIPPKRISFPNDSVRLYTESRVPVQGLSLLMIAFAIGIGPLNIWLLSRKGKKMWLWWNVPLISVLTCLAVFSYSLLAEGVQGHGKTTLFTVLDENTHRATSFGYASFYSPLSAGDGLHFSYDTDVHLLEESDDSGSRFRRGFRGTGRKVRVDWTQDQHLTSGWILPRVPTELALRKNETRRERVVFRKQEDGTVTAVNGLGVTIERLDYMDSDGQQYVGGVIGAGQEATLKKLESDQESKEQFSPRELYLKDWAESLQGLRSQSIRCLQPGTYLATTRRSPFLEVPYSGANEVQSSGIVYGICAKGDGNGR